MSCRSFPSSNDLTLTEDHMEKASPVPSIDDEDSFDGGIHAWMTLAGVFLIQVSTFGYTLSFGVYQGYYYSRFYLDTYSQTDIGWIGGVQLCLVFSVGILTGRLFDRGYFRHMMITGTFLHVFSLFMLSLSSKNQWYQVFLAHGIGSGLASGLVYIPCLAVISHHFKRHRSLAMGVVAAGTASGATLHPILLNHLFYSPIGFHNGIRISAGINSICFLLANVLMRVRQPRKPSTKTAPLPLMKLFRDPAYVLMVISSMLSSFGVFFPPFFIQLSATTQGIDASRAFYYLSMMNGTSVFGRIVVPIFCPKFGVINMNIIFAFVMSILIFCLFVVDTSTAYVVFAIFFGFVSGANVALIPPMITSLSESVDEIGARMGIAFASSGIISLFATPISGALLTNEYKWGRPILFSGICMVGSATCVVVARFVVARRKGTQLL